MKKNDFFIGWQEELPPSNRKAILKLLIVFTILGVIVIILFITNQSKFNNHFFRLGEISEVVGVYHKQPVPILKDARGNFDQEMSNDLLLVGYGKTGAEGIMESIQSDVGNLVGDTIKIRGSLIYGDGKSVFELTKQKNSFIEIIGKSNDIIDDKIHRSAVTLTGEIIDPKCYFGVMKPGEGKIHKSCAIRCISGGIPPVLKVMDNGNNSYYIITGKDGIKINSKILKFIAQPIKIRGEMYRIHGWNFLEIDPSVITLVLKENSNPR